MCSNRFGGVPQCAQIASRGSPSVCKSLRNGPPVCSVRFGGVPQNVPNLQKHFLMKKVVKFIKFVQGPPSLVGFNGGGVPTGPVQVVVFKYGLGSRLFGSPVPGFGSGPWVRLGGQFLKTWQGLRAHRRGAPFDSHEDRRVLLNQTKETHLRHLQNLSQLQ